MPEDIASTVVPRFSGSCFEKMLETYAGLSCSLEASPIGPSRNFLWKADAWSDGIVTLATGEYNGAWQGRCPPDAPESLLIAMPRIGAVATNLGPSTAEGVPGQILLINSHEAERVAVTGENHLSDVLRVNWSVVARAVSALLETPMNGSLELTPMVNLSAQPGMLIGHLIETIAMGMRGNGPLLHSPIAMSHLTQSLADLLIRLIPHRFSARLDDDIPMIAPRCVRRAIDFMQVNIDRPLTMQTVADSTGVSLRALEKSFQTFKQTTPAAYLRRMRLRAVRQDLLDPLNQQSVSEVCLKWGFFHFGRFSATYRTAYGENPSATRLNARMSSSRSQRAAEVVRADQAW